MKQYITGLLSGIILTSIITLVALVPRLDNMSLFLLRAFLASNEETPEEESAEKDPTAKFMSDDFPDTFFALMGEFLPSPGRQVQYPHDLVLIRMETALSFQPEDFDRACILSHDNEWFEIGLSFTEATQKKFQAEIQLRDDRYPSPHYEGLQRFSLQYDYKPLYGFSVEDIDRARYRDHITVHPDDYDMRLTVPFQDMYEFQNVVRSSISPAPLKACSTKVDLSAIPGWDAMIDQAWQY